MKADNKTNKENSKDSDAMEKKPKPPLKTGNYPPLPEDEGKEPRDIVPYFLQEEF